MPSDLGYGLVRASGESRQRNDYTDEEMERAKRRLIDIGKGAASAPFTWAPDLMGLIMKGAAQIPSISAGGRVPELSGDPIRQSVFNLDPRSGYGIIGEFLDPTNALAKVPSLATKLIKGTPLVAGMLPALTRSGKKAAAVGEQLSKSRQLKSGDKIGKLIVGDDIPNTSSISATFDSYDDLGVRAIPLPDTGIKSKDPDIIELAEQIKQSGRVDPLIIAIEGDSDFVLEGAHRIEALRHLGVDEFPALLIRDTGRIEPSAVPLITRTERITGGDVPRDPRFDPRVKEQDRLDNLNVGLELNPQAEIPDIVRLSDLEGQGIVTSMADRSAAGVSIVDVNGVPYYKPIRLRGGQDFMFENPGQVWASAKGPASNIMSVANDVKKATGKDPLFIPWRMAPTATDFQTMQGEVMLVHAASNMGYHAKRSLNARIKKMIPGWKGIDEPASLQQWRDAPDAVRKELKNLMDVQFRDRGGLSLGEARLAISDPAQFNARHGGIQNVGRIFTGKEPTPSTHPSFPWGIPGEGVGYVNPHQTDVGIYELLGNIGRKVDDPLNPSPEDLRSLMMGAKGSIITDKTLKALQKRGVDTEVLPLIAIIGAAFAYDLIEEEEGET